MQIASGKLATSHLVCSGRPNTTNKKGSKSKIELAPQFKGIVKSIIKDSLSQLLSSKEFCVITGFNDVSKHDVERKINEYGGNLVQNPGNINNNYLIFS